MICVAGLLWALNVCAEFLVAYLWLEICFELDCLVMGVCVWGFETFRELMCVN